MTISVRRQAQLEPETVSVRLIATIFVVATMMAPFGAAAQHGEQSGRQVVTTVCYKCHATGEKGAPRIGDKKAWGKLAREGLGALTAVALKGIREMPSHGGSPNLTDTEIARAVTYMVNNSGGKWIEPTSKTRPAGPMTGEQVVKMQCSKCHEKGVGGAPKIGDTQAWIPRLKNGLDATVLSAANGHGGMPARGGMAGLSDAELRSAITYMFKAARPANKG
ncbi:MAG: c-type cytochrome [Betaproteobacteria bacterium]